jgi:hypothetical protein
MTSSARPSSVIGNVRPSALHELKRAIDLLQPVIPASETVQSLPRSRPVLALIALRAVGRIHPCKCFQQCLVFGSVPASR